MPTELTQTVTPPTQPETSFETFEAFLEKQGEDVKGLYSTHTAGLKSALDNERSANKAAQAQLRELAKKADKGSELEAALNQQIEKLTALGKQASFQDKAHGAGVRNLKLAYIAAEQAGMVSDKGECDFSELRKLYPELFTAQASANAGAGTGTTATRPQTMDDIIKGALGRT